MVRYSLTLWHILERCSLVAEGGRFDFLECPMGASLFGHSTDMSFCWLESDIIVANERTLSAAVEGRLICEISWLSTEIADIFTQTENHCLTMEHRLKNTIRQW